MGFLQVEDLRELVLEYQSTISVELQQQARKAIKPEELNAEAEEYPSEGVNTEETAEEDE